MSEDRLDDGDDVRGLSDQRRALLEKPIGAFCPRIDRRPWNGEDFAPLLEREPRRDQRAGPLRGLDNHHTKREARNKPVAAGEILCARLPAERHLGDRGAFGEDRLQQSDVLLRIDSILASGKDRDRAGREACAVRGGIDAAGKARSNHEAGVGQLARQAFGELQSGGGRIARANHRDHRTGQRSGIAAHGKKRRGIIDLGKALRVRLLAKADQRNAKLPGRRHLMLGISPWIDTDRARGAAAAREFGQRRDCAARIAVLP